MSERHIIDTGASKRNMFIRLFQLFARIGSNILHLFTKKNTYVELICALLVILFIYTGSNKLMGMDKFKFELGRSPFIQNMSTFVAYTLPVGEIMIALALIIRRTRLIGLYLSFFLMSLFTLYIYAMLNYSSYLPCSCGGVLEALSWEDHLVFNTLFTSLAMIGVILQSKIQYTHYSGTKNALSH